MEPINQESGILSELAGINLNCGDIPTGIGSFMPSQLLQVSIYNIFITFKYKQQVQLSKHLF